MLGAKKHTDLKRKRSMNERFADPDFIINTMSDYLKEGDIASLTDLISAYISNSEKYKSQESFAKAIGTSRNTLHRMLSHDENVGLVVFFSAVERIFDDIKAT